jgi:hypothetical protein
MHDCRSEPGSFPKVHLFLAATKIMCKGFNIYVILALNEKGVAECLE